MMKFSLAKIVFFITSIFFLLIILFFYTQNKIYNLSQHASLDDPKYENDYGYIPNVARLYGNQFEIDNFIFNDPDSISYLAGYFEQAFELNDLDYELFVRTRPNIQTKKFPNTQIYIKFPVDIDLERISVEKISITINDVPFMDYDVRKIIQSRSLLITIPNIPDETHHKMIVKVPLELYSSQYLRSEELELVLIHSNADFSFIPYLKSYSQ